MTAQSLGVVTTAGLFGLLMVLAVGDPGLIVVIDEPPEAAEFGVPDGFLYQFDYDPARIALWGDIGMQVPIPPGTTFPAPPPCDVDLTDFAKLQNCFSGVGGGVAPGCGGFDGDADNDVDLDDYATFHATFVGPICNDVPVTVFVQGLTASSGLGDVMVTVLAAPNKKAEFIVQATQAVTVVSIDIAPTSGPLGTETVVTLQPAVPPIAFDSFSTAEWSGVFDPLSGPPSSPFAILYDATQVRESSSASAILVAGDGTPVNPPDFATFDFPGSLDGTLTLNLGLSLTRSSSFTPTVVTAVWESITYDDSSLSTGPPMLAGEPVELEILVLSNDPDPTPDEVVLLQSYSFHLAAVMRIAENPTTVANAPAFIEVDLVTFDIGGVEIDRRENVSLDLVTGDDGDPSNLVYHSDLAIPIVLVDVALNPVEYPNVMVLQAEGSGSAHIIPQ